jgi:NADPH:quinone reductase-like Zn-dependent oxidoreductase
MRAVVADRYGPPEILRMEDVPRPVPGAGDVLVRIRATTVTRSDSAYRAGHPPVARLVTGLRRPRQRILGSEFAGDVEAVGTAVRDFQAGDPVFGVNSWSLGAHAELICVRQSAPVAPLPTGIPYGDAAAVCDGAILALNCLRPARLRGGERVLVYGASGSIGTAGVQLAKHLGAHVTAVCAGNGLDLVRSLGADEVIDYTHEDFTRRGMTYDVIFDAVGKHSFARCRAVLNPGGAYLATDGFINLALRFLARRKRVVFAIPPRYTKQDVLMLKGLLETGEYRAVVDRTYPFEEIAEATRYVETEQKLGNVVIAAY